MKIQKTIWFLIDFAVWRDFRARCLCRNIPLIQLCWVAYPAQIWQQHFLGRIGRLRQSRKNLVAGVVYSTLCSTVSLFLPSSHFLLFWSKVVLLYYTTTTTLLWSRLMVTQRVRCVQDYHVIKLNIQTTLVIPGLHSIL